MDLEKNDMKHNFRKQLLAGEILIGTGITINSHEIAVIVQAEHVDAVKNIRSIAKVEGIDAVLVGPYDLSASFDKPGQVDDNEVVTAIDHINKICSEMDVPTEIFGVSTEFLLPFIMKGFTLIVAGVDTIFLGQAAQKMIKEVKDKVK